MRYWATSSKRDQGRTKTSGRSPRCSGTSSIVKYAPRSKECRAAHEQAPRGISIVPPRSTPLLRMSQSAGEHRAQAPTALRCAVVTVSDTRTLETDTGGGTIVELLATA